ncbi:MAG: shikimate dehydrogenase [Proteobacteria bacterium]|nr:shikimate dehydrogenase [Pseudomonadota bacterium]
MNDEQTGIIINGETKLYGIIGNPVSHSFSPEMQTLAFQHVGLNAIYVPFPIQDKSIPHLLKAFSITGVRGFNVTVPFKEIIIPYLDELSSEAKILGSVNTVIGTSEGWKGYSTDGSGFVRSLSESGIAVSGKDVMLVGAGGAARSIALSLCLGGIRRLHILNRTVSKAEKLADTILRAAPNVQVRIGSDSTEPYDILINSTSVGMHGHSCPVSDDLIRKCGLIVDIIYNPPQTSLLKKAVQNGIPQENGLGMLLYQGVEAFEIWTGKKAPIEVMKTSLSNSVRRMS